MKLSIALLAAVLSTAAFAQQETQRSPAAPNYTYRRRLKRRRTRAHQLMWPLSSDKLNTTRRRKAHAEQAQAHPTVAANFDNVDTNHDGVISKDEFLAAFKPQP